jgi:hypothetical protein
MKHFNFPVFILFAGLCSCSKSDKPATSSSPFENNLTLAPWKFNYTSSDTLSENNIIGSSNVYDSNASCAQLLSFNQNGIFDEKNPCIANSESTGKWQLQNDSLLTGGFGARPIKVTIITKDSLQVVISTEYFEKSSVGNVLLDSIQTRETFSH